MTQQTAGKSGSAGAGGTSLLTLGGIAAAFGVAACCALPVLLTTAGLGAAWLGNIAVLTEPHRALLLGISLVSLLAAAGSLALKQHQAMTCGPGGVCTPPALRGLLLLGIVAGATLLYLGYAYV